MEMILGVLRALLAAGGGYFVGKGVLDEATSQEIIGAVMTIATAVWSILAKSDKFPSIK